MNFDYSGLGSVTACSSLCSPVVHVDAAMLTRRIDAALKRADSRGPPKLR
jgi:hypothetical protein